MKRVSHLVTSAMKEKYLKIATREFNAYVSMCEISAQSFTDKQNYIDRIYALAIALIVDNNRITLQSLLDLEQKFTQGKGFEEQNLQQKLLTLFLRCLEIETGIQSPEPSSYTQIKQEQPILTCAHFMNSDFHEKLYRLLEDEKVIQAYIDDPKTYLGIFYLWLILKEGITKQRTLKTLLEHQDNFFQVDGHWFTEFNQELIWFSPFAEHLFFAKWRANVSDKTNIMVAIQASLHHYRIITPIQKVLFSDVSEALKIEYTFQFSAAEFYIASNLHKSTHLLPCHLLRLLEKKRPHIEKSEHIQQGTTVRQQRAWQKAFSSSSPNLRLTSQHNIQDVTVDQQIRLITRFISQLETLPLKMAIKRSTQLRNDLHHWLEEGDHAKQYPWCWLLLSWLYKLLEKGGKYKKRLRLSTIRAYLTYVAKPFIIEFSGCDAGLMTSIDWGEKLNQVAQTINSPTKKIYVIYFALFLIDSNFISHLCLSDIDIPNHDAGINANLLSLQEADLVLASCKLMDHAKADLASLIFAFGFFSGMRRGEISGLQFKDFHFNQNLSYFTLHVRPNKYRELKSSSSSRNLPLDVLWPEPLKVALCEFLTIHKTKNTRIDSDIFKDKKVLDDAFSLVTQVMQGVTGDETLRFHHCRHSFANWTWVRLHKSETCFQSPYPFLQHHYFQPNECEAFRKRLRIHPFSRKKLWALSSLLGHSTPETTLSSYFHLAFFIKRARFANHRPSMTLRRKMFGRYVPEDDWLHIPNQTQNGVMKPKCLSHQESLEFDISAFGDTKNDSVSNNEPLDITMIWRVIRQIAEGNKTRDVGKALSLQTSQIHAVIDSDNKIVAKSTEKSKTAFKALLDYEHLKLSEIRYLQILINQTRKRVEPMATYADICLHITQLLDDLVPSREFLIRTTNSAAIYHLLLLLKSLGANEGHLQIRWYFPNVKPDDEKLLCQCRNGLAYWKKQIIERAGFDAKHLQVIVPHNSAHLVKIRGDNVRFSDESRYLHFKDHGFVSVHFLKRVSTDMRRDNKRKIKSRRSKIFICFLRLMAIYHSLN